jgi:murein tripeptide amidase MpaA
MGYRVLASHDRRHWLRIATSFDGQVLTARLTPDTHSVYFAYFEPYSYERHLDLIGSSGQSDHVEVRPLGTTLDGRDMTLLRITDARSATAPTDKKKVWLIARQHPGETMAEWFVEGFLERLLDGDDPVSRVLLDHCVFYVVPNMNPDGAVRGNLRTNAAGANLNREWVSPSIESSPEVLFVRERLHQTGCSVFLDVHGDEGLPYVFAAGSEMLEGFTEEQAIAQQGFIDAFKQASPEFQDKRGYPSGKYHAELLKLASKYVGHHFKCVSLTLELPFKDNANMPDERVGWNGARSAQLGAACLQAIRATLAAAA